MKKRPTPRAACLALLEHLSGYIDAELTPRQRRAVQTHCRDCERCQKVVASLRRTVALYRCSRGATMSARARTHARAGVAKLLRRLDDQR